MFGKKEESILPPMKGYSKEVLGKISNYFNGSVTPEMINVDWNKIIRISIDQIDVRVPGGKLPIEMYLGQNLPNDYIKAWKKGLGRFIMKDYSSFFKENIDKSNLEKYKFLNLGNNQYAFIRFVDETDGIGDSEILDEMMKYNAISFAFNISQKKKGYCLVMKIFDKPEGFDDLEACLAQKKTIEYIDLDDFSIYDSNLSDIDETEMEIEELESQSSVVSEYPNEEELF